MATQINAETNQKTKSELLFPEESFQIRGGCFSVWREFAGAFKESIVEKALVIELQTRGLKVQQQERIAISYKGQRVGTYTPDLIVEDKILIELKSKPFLTQGDERQFWYYLKGSAYKLGFLINFGTKKLDIRRRVYDRARQR